MPLQQKAVLLALALALTLPSPCALAAPNSEAARQARDIVLQMTTREKLGQLMVLDVRRWNELPQTVLTEGCQRMLDDYDIGGVCLFADNLQDAAQATALTDAMQHAVVDDSRFHIPLMISIDEEGGFITRMAALGTVLPGPMALGATGSTDLAFRAGQLKGAEVAAVGANLNFSPVLDVNLNMLNPIIGVRSFGSDPVRVAEMGRRYVEGLRWAGVGACVKHFPGHGNTGTDTHIALASVPGTKEELLARDLIPFQTAIAGGVDLIMTAHVTVEGLDSTQITGAIGSKATFPTPATLSRPIITGLLREELGFNGLIVTDALRMGAISDNFGATERVKMALMAGVDIPLIPVDSFGDEDVKNNIQPLFEGLEAEAEQDGAFLRRIDESVIRVIAYKLSRGIFVPDKQVQPCFAKPLAERQALAHSALRSEAHLALEKEISDRAVTLAKNEGSILPFTLQEGSQVCVLAPLKSYKEHLERALAAIANVQGTTAKTQGFVYGTEGFSAEHQAAMDQADFILIASTMVDSGSFHPEGEGDSSKLIKGALDAWQYAKAKGYSTRTAGISLALPYELALGGDISALVNTYCRQQAATLPIYQSAVEVIFGQLSPQGHYPVDVFRLDGEPGETPIRAIGDGLAFQ